LLIAIFIVYLGRLQARRYRISILTVLTRTIEMTKPENISGAMVEF